MVNHDCISTKYNDYSFTWAKQLGFFVFATMDTNVLIDRLDLVMNMERRYLGLVKGKCICKTIPINQIRDVELRMLLSLSNFIIAGLFVLAGILLNPLLFLIIPFCIWGCINTNIILHTKMDQEIRIPSFNKHEAKKFVDYFKDIYLS